MRLKMIFAIAAFLFTTATIQAQGIISPRHRNEATRQDGKDQPPPPQPQLPTALPVSEIKINAKIDGQVATITVDHLFRNDGDENLEGTYYFPVPEGATLLEFAIYDGDQRRVGRVKEKGEARAAYAAGVAQGEDPALLEITKSGWFRAQVYPIPPHADKHIQIIYSQVLTPKNGTSTFDYPLGNGYKKLKVPVGKVDIDIDLRATTPIKNVFSPSHPLLLDYDGEKHVTGKLETSGGGDAENFQLVYSTSDSEVSASLITYRRQGEDGYFLLMLSPKLNFDNRKVSAKDVIFVIDVSGSMQGVKIEQAKEALRFGLTKTLNDGDRFNIVAFESKLNYMQTGLVEATSANINSALNFVSKLKATGGTAINEALVKSMKMFEPNSRPKNLVFLTDGEPSDGETRTDQIVKNVVEANTTQARLNSFGVGAGVNNLLLERLSMENRGAQSAILNESELSKTTSEFFAKVSKTVLSNLEVSFGPVIVDRLNPAQLPDLYTRSQIKIYGRYKNLIDLKDITVTLTGLMNGESERFDFNGLDFPLVTDDKPFLPKLWATERVNALMAEQRVHGEKPEIRQEVLELAKEFNLVTRYTSMYVPTTAQLEREKQMATSTAARSAVVSAGGSLPGVITDANGAAVVGATITITDKNTGATRIVTTSDQGTYSVAGLPPGDYTIQINAQGFQATTVKDVTIQSGQTTSTGVALQVGTVSEAIMVSGSVNYLQTQSANISSFTGGISQNQSYSSANAMNLIQNTTGSSFANNQNQLNVNGLSNNALSFTLDGINVQNNFANSNNGFLAYVQQKTNGLQEVTVSSGAIGSQSNSQGAVQVNFVTRGGSNDFHGSLYDYLQNPALNANYYFNNLAGLPRTRVILNQFGGQVGGPFIRDKAFFFVNYEEYRSPEAVLRQRTIMSQQAQNGIFSYLVGNNTNSVNLFSLAAANGLTATPDSTIGGLLSKIRSTTNRGSVQSLADPNLQLFSLLNSGMQLRRLPTVRFDFNITSRHHLENIYNYQGFGAGIDFLNGSDPAFPGFPNFGTQSSTRFSNSTALRSTLSSSTVNEARFGISGGTIRFLPEVNPAQFANQGGLNLNLGATGITNATVQTSPQKNNSPLRQFVDNLDWIKGVHSFKFGFEFSQINLFSQTTPGGVVPTINFGVVPNDPADSIFSAVNFPGASQTQLNQARAFYAVLTGRITGVDGTAALSEGTNTYANLSQYTQRVKQREIGSFVSDSWRVRPNLTLNGGLRWEVQFPFTAQNQSYAQTTVDQLFGISGAGNLFKPGTVSGTPTQFTALSPGAHAYNTQWGNLAPSVGLAWSPNFTSDIFGGRVQRLIGESGQMVIRAGYSISYLREGTNVMSDVYGSNPGGILNTGVSTNLGNLNTAPTLLRNGVPPLISPVPSLIFPIVGNLGNTASAFIPDLKTGRVHSWSFGIQREIDRDTVLELRYIGNRAMDLWRRYSINETDVQSNGFINEFNLAKQNLIANNAAGGARAGSFAYFGPNSDTSPLPVILGWFNGLPSNQASDPSKYSSGLFRNATFTNSLNPALPSALGFANTILANPALFLANGAAAGIPANYFVVNPGISSNAIGGGSFIVDNSNRSYYDAVVIELRRRLSRGLLFDASYTFSKSLSNNFDNDSMLTSNFVSLHDKGLDRGISPFNVNHALRGTFIYELPLGKGQHFFTDACPVVDRLVSGWSFNGTVQIQGGAPFSLGNVQLVGMTRQELQDAVRIQHGTATANGLRSPVVFWLPQDIIQNTINAFNGSFASTGRYVAPANMNAAIAYPGSTGFSNLILSGPRYTRFDLSIAKRVRITESVNFELRTEMLNAFNNINFRVNTPAGDGSMIGGLGSNTFGQTTTAYQDLMTANNPGGRLIQFVARLNF